MELEVPVTSSVQAANVQVGLLRGFHPILRLSPGTPGRLGGSGCYCLHRPLPNTVPVSVTITAIIINFSIAVAFDVKVNHAHPARLPFTPALSVRTRPYRSPPQQQRVLRLKAGRLWPGRVLYRHKVTESRILVLHSSTHIVHTTLMQQPPMRCRRGRRHAAETRQARAAPSGGCGGCHHRPTAVTALRRG